MPTVKIELVKGRDLQSLIKIRDLVLAAIIDSLQLPSDDKTIRIIEYEQEFFQLKDPYRMLVEITLFAGRSKDSKRKLYKSIATYLESAKLIHKDEVLIVLNEQPLENWGIRGGFPADEIDLGFTIQV